MRRRLGLLSDGTYRATSWTEWEDDFYTVPCTLTVHGDRLVFDYTGASPQTSHFFNSKPYIIESEMVAQLAWLMARDLPFDDGIFAPIELRCPEGTIVNSIEPAPIAAAHMDVALNAAEIGVQCLRLALAASPGHPSARYVAGWGSGSALGLHTWSCTGIDGRPDAFIMLDGNWVGSSASDERDGLPLAGNIVGPESGYSFTDIEILESWYPILVTEKRSRPGPNGAGRHRAGGGNQMGFRPHGTERLTGAMLGMRRWLPLEGAAGGLPGACTRFLVHRAGGTTEEVATHASGLVLGQGDTFQFLCANGGGFGDPLDRDPASVARDVALGRITAAEAADAYGVVLGDAAATAARREELRLARLARALPPAQPTAGAAPSGDALALYPGVVNRGGVAVAAESGAVLGVAPGHWTDGCPVLVERRSDHGPEVVTRSYLDPQTGRILYAEVAPAGEGRGFETTPRHWAEPSG